MNGQNRGKQKIPKLRKTPKLNENRGEIINFAEIGKKQYASLT